VFKTLKTNLFLTMSSFAELLHIRDDENTKYDNNILLNFTLSVSADENKDNLLGRKPWKKSKIECKNKTSLIIDTDESNSILNIDNFYINIEVEIVSCLAPLLSFIKALIPSCFVGAVESSNNIIVQPEYEEGMKIYYYKKGYSVKKNHSNEDKIKIDAIVQAGEDVVDLSNYAVGMLTNKEMIKSTRNNGGSSYPGILLEGTIIHSDSYKGPFKVLCSSGSRDENVLARDIVYTVKPVIEFQNFATLMDKIKKQSFTSQLPTNTSNKLLVKSCSNHKKEQPIISTPLIVTSAHLLRIFKYATSNKTSPRIFYRSDISNIFEEEMEMIAGTVSWLLINNLFHHLQGISCWNDKEDDNENITQNPHSPCSEVAAQLVEFHTMLDVNTTSLDWLKTPNWRKYSEILLNKLAKVIEKHKHDDRRRNSIY
jgi:hypothetical protein